LFQGHVIIEEGEPSSEIFIIQSGTCQVTTSGVHLGALHKGAFFGEVTALGLGLGPNGKLNSRTVTVADGDCHLSYFGADSIATLCKKHPQLQSRLARHVELRKYREDVEVRAEKWASVVPTMQAAKEVRKTPSWPRSWANFRLL
jgi:CRP-like cAMP-binding protein